MVHIFFAIILFVIFFLFRFISLQFLEKIPQGSFISPE